MIKRWVVPLLVAALLSACTQAPPRTVGLSASPSPSSRTPTFEDKVKAVLGEQAKALLRGDEEGFLRPARDPGVRQALSLRLRNLTAMRVAKAELRIGYLRQSPSDGSKWGGETETAFCFVVPDCALDSVLEPVLWADTPAGPELLRIEVARGTGEQFGDPQPWEMTDLAVAHGQRVVVAAPKSLAHRLPAVVKAAEAATSAADTFVVGRLRPDLYRVYLADDTAWRSWFGRSPARWVAGYAKAIGDTHTDVVLHHASAPDGYLAELLRHELVHAAGLQGKYEWRGNWWLIEGVAELAGRPGAGADRSLRAFIRNRWDRVLPLNGPPDDATDEQANELYGVAFLAVKRLDSRFGREKLLTFIERVINSGESREAASARIFEVPWDQLQADLVAAVRSA